MCADFQTTSYSYVAEIPESVCKLKKKKKTHSKNKEKNSTRFFETFMRLAKMMRSSPNGLKTHRRLEKPRSTHNEAFQIEVEIRVLKKILVFTSKLL